MNVRGAVMWAVATFALAVGALGAGTAARAGAQALPVVELMPRHTTGKCLDVAHASQDHAARVVQGNCEGRPNQRWVVREVGLRTFELRALHSNKCLDVAHMSHAHAAPVVQADCRGTDNQRWFRSGGNAVFTFQALHSGQCLDVAHMSHAHAAPVVQARCMGTLNQAWSQIQVGTISL